jgi:hypothetical protein
MQKYQHHLVWVTLLLACFGVPVICMAGYGKSGVGGGGGGGSSPPPPPVDHSASIAARKQLGEATAEFNKANHAAVEILNSARHDCQQRPAWIAAQSALKADQARVDAARGQVMATLEKDAGYLSLKAAKLKADEERDTASKDPGLSPADRQNIVQTALTASAACTKRLNESLQSDAAFTAAQAQVAADSQKINALLGECDAATKQSPQYQSATAAVEQKQQALADARKLLASAMASEAQAR